MPEIVARRDESNRKRQDGSAKQGRAGNEPDLCGIESDLRQIDRKHNDRKAIAKAAQCARAVEE
jgi:hypothetical protein